MSITDEQTIVVSAAAYRRLMDMEKGLQDQRDSEEARVMQIINDLRNARTALSNFEDKVRDAAIRVQRGHSGHIGVEELNEWLVDLGLEPVLTQFRCTGDWRGFNLPEAEVMAVDEEDAEEKYGNAVVQHLRYQASISGTLDDTDGVVFALRRFEERADEETLDADDFNIYVEAV